MNNLKIRKKLLILYIFCVFVPIFTINILFYRSLAKLILERENLHLNQITESYQNDLEKAIEDCVLVGETLYLDRTLNEYINNNFKSHSGYINTYNKYLLNTIQRYEPVFNQIDTISIYTQNNTIVNGGKFFIIDDNIDNLNWYKSFKKSKLKRN